MRRAKPAGACRRLCVAGGGVTLTRLPQIDLRVKST
jgi:hypothetical protein